MVGLIWFVQIVHYPLFAIVPAATFEAYSQGHTGRTFWVVMPPMFVEVISGILLACFAPGSERPLWVASLLALGVIWLSTWEIQIPLHNRLQAALSLGDVRRLVLTNWLRTILWSGRGLIVCNIIYDRLKGSP
jgi:hypothetical protein